MSFAFEDFDGDEVAGGAGPTYPNGYPYRRALRVSGAVVTGPAVLADLPLRFDETLPSLKSDANGGNVQSANGWDIRFESTSGTKLRHELETYDPVAGRAAGWVRIPSATPGVDLDILMYYGKPSLAGPEEDTSTAGTWERCLGCWRAPDGRDMTGHGRHLTTSGVTSGSVLGHPAAVLTSSAYLELLDVTHMNARSQYTPVLLVQPSSLPSGNADFLRYGGTASGTGKLGFTHYDQPDIAKALRNYSALGGSTAFLIGPANSAVAGHAFTWALAVKSGAWPVQYLDGAAVASTQRGSLGTGTTSFGSTDLLRIGVGYGDNTTCVPGSYGRHWVFDSALSADFLAFLDLTVRAPHAVYGIGDEDASADADRSPVMAPVTATVGAGNGVDIDVLARAGDPDGQGMTAGLASPSPSLGTASIAANLVRYAAGSVQGLDRFGVTATAGTKTARALCSVTVGTGGPPGGGTPLPVAPLASRNATWEMVKSAASSSSFVQGTADVELRGAVVANGSLGLVTIIGGAGGNGMFNPPFVLDFDYEPTSLSESPPAGGIFSQLGLYRRSDGGGSSNLASLGGPDGSGVWTADYPPTDDYYRTTVSGHPHARGIRFSFDTNSAGSGSNQIRGRSIADDGTISGNFAYGGGGQKTFDFRTPGGKSHLSWDFPGGTSVTVAVTSSGGTTTTQVFDDPLIAQWLGSEARNILLMVNEGRRALISNVSVTTRTVGGPPLARWFAAAPLAAVGTRHSVVGPATFPTGTIGAGGQYVVENDIDLGGATKTLVFGGSSSHAAYFRGDREGLGPSGLRTISNGTIRLSGSRGILRGLCFKRCKLQLLASDTLQVESNWFCDIGAVSTDHYIVADGKTDVINLLVAFNLWKRKTSETSAGIIALDSIGIDPPSTGRAKFYNAMFYRNEIQRDSISDGQNWSGMRMGSAVYDTFRDLGMTVMENLWIDSSSGNVIEIKYPGTWFVRNTIELTSASSSAGGQVRQRHGRIDSDPATDIDQGRSNLIEENLWVWAGPGGTEAEINTRDGFSVIRNNWGVTLAAGAQPIAATSSNGRLRINLFSAHLDWQGYPASDVRGGGSNYMNAGKSKVGGNRATVVMGFPSADTNAFKPDSCRVAPASGARVDRNANVTVNKGETNTDKTGTVVGADFNLVPHRMRSEANGFAASDVEVGTDGYDPSGYGIQDT